MDALRDFLQQEFRRFLAEIGMDPDQYLDAVAAARSGRTIPLDQMIAEVQSAVAR